MRLAIAEPDAALADVLTFAAKRRGHQTLTVPTPDKLLGTLPFQPSVAIVSLDGSTRSIEALLRVCREHPEMPVLVTIEGAREPAPRLLLQAGARDVIRIPYNPYEVVARAEAWDAARAQGGDGEVVRLGDIEVDLGAYVARKNGEELPLTKLELRLIYCLCEHHPNVAPLERLLTFGWEGMDDPDATLLKTHVSHLRKKLASAGGDEVKIVSRQSIGYRLEMDAA